MTNNNEFDAQDFGGTDIPIDIMGNLIIGMGSCGTQIMKLLSKNPMFDNCILYAIDSDINTLNLVDEYPNIKVIPMEIDEMNGAGRNRPRGRELFEEAVTDGLLDELYLTAENVRYPIIIVSSTAGGTGSGALPVMCKHLIEQRGAYVTPIIVTPDNIEDNHSHRNNSQLFIELAKEAGVTRYVQFVNPPYTAQYDPINEEISTAIEWMLGKHYHPTDKNSIDDADLDIILNGPSGRVMVLSATGRDVKSASRALEKQLFAGFQPTFTKDELTEDNCSLVVGFSIESLDADEEFVEAFKPIRDRIAMNGDKNFIDNEYRHICVSDNNGNVTLSVIIAGLPRPYIKQVVSSEGSARNLSDGLREAVNPTFMRTSSTIRRRRTGGSHAPSKIRMQSASEIKTHDES